MSLDFSTSNSDTESEFKVNLSLSPSKSQFSNSDGLPEQHIWPESALKKDTATESPMSFSVKLYKKLFTSY